MSKIPVEHEEKDTWYQVSGHGIYYTKKEGIVTIKFSDTITANTNITLTDVIPQNYRPYQELQFPALGGNVDDNGIVVIYPNGNLLFYVKGSGATNVIRTTATYII